ncbi:unnamed protein product [Absidia cylindrospora]
MKLSSIWIVSSICIFNNVVDAGIFSNRASPAADTAAKEDSSNTGSTNKNGGVEKKMDYKLSFKVPYLYGNEVPFWSAGGDTITSRDIIRLSPSIPGSTGWLWSNLENDYENWMVDMDFRVSGSQIHGGRGMAFWYSKHKLPTGPIFGAQDQWEGLSIWFDTANPKTRHPTIMAFMNDGKFSYASEGVDPNKRALATCHIDYRNPTSIVKMRLTYKDKILTMMLDNTSLGKKFRPCFQLRDITLPPGYHFGLTASSHNPADDHDIISFETFQLDPPPKKANQKRPLEDAKIQQGEEFIELSEEQRKKIEEAESEIKRLREHTSNIDLLTETAATMGVLFDTERRILETLQVNQLQLEAMGAPTADKILSGDYVQTPLESRGDGNKQASGISVNHLKSETQLVIQRLEQQWNQRDQQLQSIQGTMSRMEALIQTMDKRMALQSNNLQGKLSEMTKDSAETKGTMSTLIKYVLYACGLQGLVGIGAYLYWKLRVEKNEKKFL